MTAERTEEATPGRLRALSHSIALGSLSAVGALLVARDATSVPEAVVLVVGLVSALMAASLWTQGRGANVVLPCLAVNAAVWALGVLVTESATASFSLSIVGTIAVFGMSRRRGLAAAGLVAFAAAVVAVELVRSPGNYAEVLTQFAFVSAAVAVTGSVLTALNQVVADLSRQLEESRRREAELAVMRERMRFASDLHDIQGHTLHVVKLKTTLAQKLLRSDIERAEQELQEVHALVGDTIAQTKELAYAQRRLNPAAELENAKNLFEAAGIHVRVDREAEVDRGVSELLGQVLREATTNILRHAQARQVHITLSERGVSIANDGAQDGPLPALRGLATLKERVADDGGGLTVRQQNGRFLVAAEFPHAAADAAEPAAVEGQDR